VNSTFVDPSIHTAMSGCTLRFTRNTPFRTVLVDEVTGQAKYEIDTPIRLVRSVTRIRKFDTPPQHPLRWDDGEFDSVDITGEGGKEKKGSGDGVTNVGVKKPKKDKKVKEDEKDEREKEETKDEVARIYWKWFSSDGIIFRGRTHRRTEFLPKCGKMKGSYMFTGPDGIQYRWAMGRCGMNFPKLVTTDGKKTVVAQFHRAHYIRNKRKARLEVQPAGMEMLDYIVLTFVFAESKRREREARARSGG